MKSLFNKRASYKPFWYPWAYEAFVASEQMHWLAREVSLSDDVKDWKTVLDPNEKLLLTQIFRFFTQADVDVSAGYIERYLPVFRPPELRMMMSSIAAREAVHIQAYSTLIDELGIPEAEYNAFLEYQAMKDKHEFLFQERPGEHIGLALDIATFSAFGEGLQLFASFVILLNFTRFGKMRGMGQMISWSIRDETHHVSSMLRVYHELLAEVPIHRPTLAQRVREIAAKMVELEDKFIDLAYSGGGIEGLSAEEVKDYIRYIADIRLGQLGEPALFGVRVNPLPWVDAIVFGKEHTNFFENRATDYSKGALEGNWDEAFS